MGKIDVLVSRYFRWPVEACVAGREVIGIVEAFGGGTAMLGLVESRNTEGITVEVDDPVSVEISDVMLMSILKFFFRDWMSE
jgi:hypothetical protein